jgi:hypothetical protein
MTLWSSNIRQSDRMVGAEPPLVDCQDPLLQRHGLAESSGSKKLFDFLLEHGRLVRPSKSRALTEMTDSVTQRTGS